MKTAKTKRAEAEARHDIYRTLTALQILAILDKRLGKGVGARKQRAKLEKEGK